MQCCKGSAKLNSQQKFNTHLPGRPAAMVMGILCFMQ